MTRPGHATGLARSLTVTVAAAVALLTVACAGSSSIPAPAGSPRPSAAGQRSVERLRLAGGDFGYPSPFAWVRGPGWIQAGYVFDTLLWRDSTGGSIPWLATAWEANPEGTEWRFTLNPDATWHDGQPVTARDVVFTWRYMTSGPGADAAGFAARGLDIVDEVFAPSEREVVFRLKQPYAAFEENVAASVLIIPEHIWADVTDPGQWLEPGATIGSGPYQLEQADPAEGSYLYVANPDFYIQRPVVQRLEFIPVGDELVAFQRGELDAAEVELEAAVPQEQLDALASDPSVGVLEAPGDWNLALHFNLDAGFPYDRVEFRHAIAYAIDRVDLVDRVLFGRGQPGSTGGLAPAHPYTVDDLPTYPYDPERSGRLLDELGLVDTDGDGFRDLPDGRPWVQELKASNRFSTQTPKIIAEYLKRVGINVEIQILDRATADEAGAEGNYTMMLHGYGGIMSDPDTLRTRFHSQSRSRSFTRAHGYANGEFDELADQQLATTDRERRFELVAQMQRILAEDLPVLSLYVPDRILFFDKDRFDGWYYTPGCSPCRGSRNKHMFVTASKVGFDVSS